VNLKPLSWNDTIVETSVFFLFSLFFSLDYLSQTLGIIPRQFTWLPEVISIGILFYLFIRLFREKDLVPIFSRTQLVIFFIALTLIGLIINRVDTPVALAGIRNNLKYLPLFFLPFFYKFDKSFLQRFLAFLLLLALLQFPVTIIQRIVYKTTSGDPIGGSLGAQSSGILSVFLALCLVFWSFYFIKGKLKPIVFFAGFMVLISPMGLNETKVSFFILPVAFVCIFLFTRYKKIHIKKILIVFVCFSVGMILIGSLFNHMYVQERNTDKKVVTKKINSSPKNELKLSESSVLKEKKPARYKAIKYFDPNRLMTLLYKNEILKRGALNRIPQVIFAFNHIKTNPVRLLFGVGAGNASDSFFEKAKGEYYKKYGELDIGNNLLSRLLWEYGLIGTLLFFSIFIFLFLRIWKLRTGADIMGAAASGYLVLIVIFSITSVYFNTMLMNLFGYLFWFLGGYLLAYRYHRDALKETNK